MFHADEAGANGAFDAADVLKRMGGQRRGAEGRTMNFSAGDPLDIVQKIVATFAYFIGAFWVLMNYIRNRTHVARLQVEVKAEIVTRENRRYLLATIRVKNLGLSKIKLPPTPTPLDGPGSYGTGAGPEGSALIIQRLRDEDAEIEPFEAVWESPQGFEVLENHTSIEPGLTIYQQKAIQLPDNDYGAWWVRLRVKAHDQSWSAVSIAFPERRPLNNED